MKSNKNIAVIIPCYNEEITIHNVIMDFKKYLPSAEIYVFDNNSTDNTVKIAENSGAVVIKELRQGKGFVNQAFMEKIDADIYVTVDGDETYPIKDVNKLIQPIIDQKADMVVGSRLIKSEKGSFKRMHRFGNKFLTFVLNKLFRTKFEDILSGFRVFSRNFIDTVPLITGGFETETEMTIQAIERNMIIMEIPIGIKSRPKGSYAKLRTYRDGLLILLTIAMYLRDHNPLRFFTFIAFFWIILAEVILFYSSLALLDKIDQILIQGMILIISILLLIGGTMLSAINTRFAELEINIKKYVK